MNVKLRSYYGNHLFRIPRSVFAGLLVLFLANIWFYIFHLQHLGFMQDIVRSSKGLVTTGIIYNSFSIVVFYFLFNCFRRPRTTPPFFKNNTASASIVLLISVGAFFIVSPFYEKDELLLVPGGVDYLDLFLCAVLEEVVFRYFILGIFFYFFSGLPVFKRLWFSVLATSGVFTLAHVFSGYENATINAFNYLSLFAFSIAICWVYIKFSNILLVAFMHFIGNFILNYLPLTSPGYSAGFLFFIFVLVLIAGRGNHIKKALRRFRIEKTVRLASVKMTSKMPK